MRRRGYWILYGQLIAYATVFVVPLLSVSLWSYRSLADRAKQEVVETHGQLIEQLKQTVEREFQQLRNTLLQIEVNPTLSAYLVRDDLIAGRRAIDTLRSYTMANSFTLSSFLFYAGGRYLYSDTSTFLPEIYINHIHRFERWTPSRFLRDIESLREPRIMIDRLHSAPDGYRTDVVVFAAPIPVGSTSPNPTRVAYFIIDLARYRVLLDTIAESSGALIAITDPDGVPVVGSTTVMDEDWIRISAFITGGHQTHGYETVRSESAFPNWAYVAMVPESQTIPEIDVLQQRFARVVGGVIAAGMMLVYVMTRLTYRPIRLLRLHAQHLSSADDSELNELETIRAALDDAVAGAGKLRHDMSQMAPAVAQELLREVLEGRVGSPEQLSTRRGAQYVRLTHDCYFVVVVQCSKCGHQGAGELVQTAARKVTVHGLDVNPLVSIHDNIVILVCSFDRGLVPSHGQTVTTLRRALATAASLPLSIAVGTCKTSLPEIAESYREALVALECRHAGLPEDVLLYREVRASGIESYSYPFSVLEELEGVVYSANMARAESCMEKLKKYSVAVDPPIFVLRQLCHDVIGIIGRSAGSTGDGERLVALSIDEVHAIERMDDFDRVFQQLRRIIVERALTQAVRNRLTDGAARSHAILKYINNHFSEPDFCAQRIADEFGISLSSVSRSLKASQGASLTDYVAALRVRRAKHLLRTTEMTLEEVTQAIGYFNASSFARRFRQDTGVTPGAYRRMTRT